MGYPLIENLLILKMHTFIIIGAKPAGKISLFFLFMSVSRRAFWWAGLHPTMLTVLFSFLAPKDNLSTV